MRRRASFQVTGSLLDNSSENLHAGVADDAHLARAHLFYMSIRPLTVAPGGGCGPANQRQRSQREPGVTTPDSYARITAWVR
jgi:hypothetical protein